MLSPSKLFAQVDVAAMLGVTRQAVANRIAFGKLEFVVVGKTRFVPWRAVQKWHKERSERGQALAELQVIGE